MTKQTYSLSNSFKFTKYLTLLVGIYCICFVMPTILLKRSVVIPLFGVIPISILFTGTYFVLLDVITEVYGYYEGKKAIYAGLIAYTIFVFIMEFVLSINCHLPVNLTDKIANNDAYNLIFNNIYVTWFAVVFCTLVFDILNIRLLSKWKFLLKGKYFIFRTITASSFAIILFSLVTNLFAFHKQIFAGDIQFYLTVNIVSISAKIISLVIFSVPAMLLVQYLKKSEQLDITHNTNVFMFNTESK
jgi:uncharacterized PurR-regulated membrane protein YhhQ (DUF165 family)